MRVALRVDASETIGSGHLRRCLSLAQALNELGAVVDLLVRRLDVVAPQILSDVTLTKELRLHWLPPPIEPCVVEVSGPPHQEWAGVRWAQDVRDSLAVLRDKTLDWLVVDHYAFDGGWHAAMRHELGCKVLVIDDLADRTLDADTLLDQNWSADYEAKYAGCLLRQPHWLIGPRYALLSAAYRDAARYRFHEIVRSLGIFLGGTDPGGASRRVLEICRNSGFTGPIEIVSTSANPHLARLRHACNADPSAVLTLDEPDLASFFARHDLQVGAGGGATWERCCIGVPAIGLVLAVNQMAVLPSLDKLGVVRAARLDQQSEPIEMPVLSQMLAKLLDDADARRSLGERAFRLVDARGAQRVALSMLCDRLIIRPAMSKDGQMLHRWRNHPSVRAVSGNGKPISLADHLVWLKQVLAADDRWLFVAETGRLSVGCIRFDRLASDRLEVSLYLDPALQGLGLGRRLLLSAEEYIGEQLDQGFMVFARVLPGNASSQRMFEACGYRGGPFQYQKIVGDLPTLH